MAKSRLEIQKEILEKVNARVDGLVSAILQEAETTRGVVDASKMNELDRIIGTLEGMDFSGNADLLRETKAVYDKAIAAIKEQLESEESKDFKDYSIDSLKDAKKLLEEQSSLGRVGTMISKLDEISKGEADGTIERRYNDSKIEELDYSIKKREKQEEQRIEPFNNIIDVTRDPMEELNRYNEILKQIQEIDKKISKLQAEIAKPETKEEDKKAKQEEIKNLGKKKIELYKSARTDEKDTEFEYDKSKDKDATAYVKRIQACLNGRINTSRTAVIDALETIKDEEIEVCGTKMKISAYLKDYMDKSKLAKVDELRDKIEKDKVLTKMAIGKEDAHKKMDELKQKKQVYEDRNNNLQNTDVGNKRGNTAAPVVYEDKKFDWRHPFKSIANWFRRGSNSNSNPAEQRKVGKQEEKYILTQIEKEMGSDFRKLYKVEIEKDEITVNVEQSLNQKREEFYRQQNNGSERN